VTFGSADVPQWLSPIGGNIYGYLLDVSTDQIAYATQASEGAYIVSQDRKFEMKLEILRANYQHSDEKMYVSFKRTDLSVLSRIVSKEVSSQQSLYLHDLFIEFEVKHSYFNALIRAVNRLSTGNVKRILPILADFCALETVSEKFVISMLLEMPPNLTIYREDEDQLKALYKILSCVRKSPPIIVDGSFGTGKTRLLAVATYCVVQHGLYTKEPVRVLVCAHHQASADYFIENFFGPMFVSRDISLVRLKSMSYNVRSSSYYKHLYKTGHEYTSQVGHNLPRHLVVVTTFLTAPALLRVFQAGDFTHVFLDEGSQSREPETIAPLSLAGPDTKIVIAGDSMQVI
jgi:hypothetical protein